MKATNWRPPGGPATPVYGEPDPPPPNFRPHPDDFEPGSSAKDRDLWGHYPDLNSHPDDRYTNRGHPASAPAPSDPDQQSQPARDEEAGVAPGHPVFQDKLWAFLFLAHLVVMIGICIAYAPAFIAFLRRETEKKPHKIGGSHSVELAVLVLCSAVLAGIIAGFWLKIVENYAGLIVKLSMAFTLVSFGLAAIIAIFNGSPAGALLPLGLAALMGFYFYLVRRRIPFAQAILGVASKAVMEHYGTIWVAYAMAALEVVWLAFWMLTAGAVNYALTSGTAVDPERPSRGAHNFAYLGLVLSLLWGSQVIKYLTHMTTAGSTASWLLQPGYGEAPSRAAFRRAATYSFGSVCLGALILAAVRLLRIIAQSARQQAAGQQNIGQTLMAMCCSFLIGCLEWAVRLFNRYAFALISIYGGGFVSSAKQTWDLFRSRGLDAIINDDLSGMVLQMGSLAAAVLCGALAMLWAAGLGWSAWWAAGLAAALSAFLVASIVMTTVDSAVSAVFLVWALDPREFQARHPEDLHKIREAAAEMYPNQSF